MCIHLRIMSHVTAVLCNKFLYTCINNVLCTPGQELLLPCIIEFGGSCALLLT